MGRRGGKPLPRAGMIKQPPFPADVIRRRRQPGPRPVRYHPGERSCLYRSPLLWGRASEKVLWTRASDAMMMSSLQSSIRIHACLASTPASRAREAIRSLRPGCDPPACVYDAVRCTYSLMRMRVKGIIYQRKIGRSEPSGITIGPVNRAVASRGTSRL